MPVGLRGVSLPSMSLLCPSPAFPLQNDPFANLVPDIFLPQ